MRWTTAHNESRARILLEASTESEWVARHLESLGHEVIVADPNYAPMYANRSRRTKTDKRDARTLMDACETGAWRPAYRLSEARRHVRAELAVRDALVRTRTRYIALAKTLVDALERPASQPNRVQSWTEATCFVGGVAAALCSSGARVVGALPHAASATQPMRRKMGRKPVIWSARRAPPGRHPANHTAAVAVDCRRGSCRPARDIDRTQARTSATPAGHAGSDSLSPRTEPNTR